MSAVDDHDLLLVTWANRLGWWAECCCGWIGNGRVSAATAHLSHDLHRLKELSSSQPPDVASGPASPQVRP